MSKSFRIGCVYGEFGREVVITDVVDIPPLKIVLDPEPPIRYAAGGYVHKSPFQPPYYPGTEHWVTEDNIHEIARSVKGWSVFKVHGEDVLWPNEPDGWLGIGYGIGYGIGCKIQIPSE